MDIPKLRKEYEHAGISEADLHDCPIELFRRWFDAAVEYCPGQWFEPNAMSLATSADNKVTVRIVLMKQITDSGIRFFTNYESNKAIQMESNPRVSAVLHWPYLGRQVRMDGTVEKTSREVSDEYFQSRPRGSQIGAVVSKQSSVLASRDELDQKALAVEQEFAGQVIPTPDYWGGYELTATRMEFWQGRSDRLHDRIVYQLERENWTRFRLAP